MDFLCLQRVVLVDIQRQIYQGLRDTYPYIFSAVDLRAEVDLEEPACTESDLLELRACIQRECAPTDEGIPLTCIPERYS